MINTQVNIKRLLSSRKKIVVLVDIPDLDWYWSNSDKNNYTNNIEDITGINKELDIAGGFSNVDSLNVTIQANDEILEKVQDKDLQEKYVEVNFAFLKDFSEDFNSDNIVKVYSGTIDSTRIKGRQIEIEISHQSKVEKREICDETIGKTFVTTETEFDINEDSLFDVIPTNPEAEAISKGEFIELNDTVSRNYISKKSGEPIIDYKYLAEIFYHDSSNKTIPSYKLKKIEWGGATFLDYIISQDISSEEYNIKRAYIEENNSITLLNGRYYYAKRTMNNGKKYIVGIIETDEDNKIVKNKKWYPEKIIWRIKKESSDVMNPVKINNIAGSFSKTLADYMYFDGIIPSGATLYINFYFNRDEDTYNESFDFFYSAENPSNLEDNLITSSNDIWLSTDNASVESINWNNDFYVNKDTTSFPKDRSRFYYQNLSPSGSSYEFDRPLTITLTNISGSDLDMSNSPLQIPMVMVSGQQDLDLDNPPETVYFEAENHFDNSFNMVENLLDKEINYTNITKQEGNYLPPISTFFNEKQGARDVLDDLCQKHCIYSFYDNQNNLKLRPVKKYEDLQFSVSQENTPNDRDIFTDTPQNKGYEQHGIHDLEINTKSKENFRFKWAYSPIVDKYYLDKEKIVKEDEYIDVEIESDLVDNIENGEQIFDIKKEKICNEVFFADFTSSISAVRKEIGDVVNIQSFETKKIFPDTYDEQKWVIIAKELNIFEKEGRIRFKAYNIKGT